jgi:hypothetical protein
MRELLRSIFMWKEKLKKQWDENPLGCIAIAALAATAAAKLIDSMSAAQGRKAYARQIDYKIMQQR